MADIMLHSGSFLVDGRPDSFSFGRFVVRDAAARKVKLPVRDIIALTWLSGKSTRKWKVSAAAGALGAAGTTGLLAAVPLALPLAGFAAAAAAACTALGIKTGTSEAVTFLVAFKDRRFFSATAARSTFEAVTEAWMKVGGPAQTLDALTASTPAPASPRQMPQSDAGHLPALRERQPGEGWERVALPAPERQERGIVDAAFDAGSKVWTAAGDAAGYVAEKLPELPSLDAAKRWIPRLTWDKPGEGK